FGVMIILLLLFIHSDLLNSWKDTIAEDAPNHFLINVQDHQKEEIEKFLIQHGLKDINFDPMIRGRLSKINNQSINLDDYENQRAQRLLQREFNLSYQQDLPEGNKLVNGYWINQKKP